MSVVTSHDLHILNLDPIRFLATVAIYAGAPAYASFIEAEAVVLEREGDGPIALSAASTLCDWMRTWAVNMRTTPAELAGPGMAESTADLDTLFERYQNAWLAYQQLQPDRPAPPVPYLRVLSDASQPGRRDAAIELNLARLAWLSAYTER